LLRPLLVGLAATFGTIIFHALIVGLIIRRVRRDLERGWAGVHLWADVAFVANATLLALAGHLVEMGLWAIVLYLCGEFSDSAAAFYHSAVNYTTLGYGDIVMSARWKLLGPLEASDGMLMFGVSTALIFAVVLRFTQVRFGEPDR
jgi:ion channel